MFAKTIKIFALVLVVLTITFSLFYQYNPNIVVLSIAITFGTISYHFLMRLAVSYVINGIIRNRFNYKRKWFQEKKFEKRLYEVLRVKKWKDKMPTFAPVLATLIWGTFWVFFITSVLAAGVESMFVIMQRYNRPRVIRMIEKERKGKA